MPTPDWFSELLSHELEQWVRLSELQIGQLYEHYEQLLLWNQRMNLTTVKAGADTVIRHYCESLFFAAHIPAENSTISVLDLGSGPGFPGVPIAVLKPDWRVTLVESNQKKAVFLRESSRQLKNVSILAERMEAVTEQGNWVVARAVNLGEVIQQVPRLARNVGWMLSEKDFSSVRNDSHIAWAEPVRLPWGDRKLCVYGRFT